MQPKEVSEVFAAFPANVIGEYLPEWDDIPEEFQKGWNHSGGPCSLASALFSGTYLTGKVDKPVIELVGKKPSFAVKEGVDPSLVWPHLDACLRSFEPKHEHKIAGVGYLISQWINAFLIDGKVLWKQDDVELSDEFEYAY
jgi:hypothetical protein